MIIQEIGVTRNIHVVQLVLPINLHNLIYIYLYMYLSGLSTHSPDPPHHQHGRKYINVAQL